MQLFQKVLKFEEDLFMTDNQQKCDLVKLNEVIQFLNDFLKNIKNDNSLQNLQNQIIYFYSLKTHLLLQKQICQNEIMQTNQKNFVINEQIFLKKQIYHTRNKIELVLQNQNQIKQIIELQQNQASQNIQNKNQTKNTEELANFNFQQVQQQTVENVQKQIVGIQTQKRNKSQIFIKPLNEFKQLQQGALDNSKSITINQGLFDLNKAIDELEQNHQTDNLDQNQIKKIDDDIIKSLSENSHVSKQNKIIEEQILQLSQELKTQNNENQVQNHNDDFNNQLISLEKNLSNLQESVQALVSSDQIINQRISLLEQQIQKQIISEGEKNIKNSQSQTVEKSTDTQKIQQEKQKQEEKSLENTQKNNQKIQTDNIHVQNNVQVQNTQIEKFQDLSPKINPKNIEVQQTINDFKPQNDIFDELSINQNILNDLDKINKIFDINTFDQYGRYEQIQDSLSIKQKIQQNIKKIYNSKEKINLQSIQESIKNQTINQILKKKINQTLMPKYIENLKNQISILEVINKNQNTNLLSDQNNTQIIENPKVNLQDSQHESNKIKLLINSKNNNLSLKLQNLNENIQNSQKNKIEDQTPVIDFYKDITISQIRQLFNKILSEIQLNQINDSQLFDKIVESNLSYLSFQNPLYYKNLSDLFKTLIKHDQQYFSDYLKTFNQKKLNQTIFNNLESNKNEKKIQEKSLLNFNIGDPYDIIIEDFLKGSQQNSFNFEQKLDYYKQIINQQKPQNNQQLQEQTSLVNSEKKQQILRQIVNESIKEKQGQLIILEIDQRHKKTFEIDNIDLQINSLQPDPKFLKQINKNQIQKNDSNSQKKDDVELDNLMKQFLQDDKEYQQIQQIANKYQD